jgi:hypothetical protein
MFPGPNANKPNIRNQFHSYLQFIIQIISLYIYIVRKIYTQSEIKRHATISEYAIQLIPFQNPEINSTISIHRSIIREYTNQFILQFTETNSIPRIHISARSSQNSWFSSMSREHTNQFNIFLFRKYTPRDAWKRREEKSHSVKKV